MTQDAQITLFLTQLKEAIDHGRFVLVNREKNLDFLFKYGLSLYKIKEVIHDLQVKDYVSGPEEDHKYPHEGKNIWKFKKVYLKIDIYIKIKLVLNGDLFYAKCLSFHDS